jgi:ADP-dependent NAD(P)H-hydrate dehydratase / NAD(P)H-hydrate epimerase
MHFSKEHQCIVVLKNAYTAISSPEGNLYFNTSGNQGMATGGSGDVLTGVITGLLAQNYLPLHAALLGVYFHGKAGDEAACKKGYNALIASDIIDALRIEKS